MLKNKQSTAVSIRATMQQQHLASARNRRLAQQMENRPSVQAALNHKQVRTSDKISVSGPFTINNHVMNGGMMVHGCNSNTGVCGPAQSIVLQKLWSKTEQVTYVNFGYFPASAWLKAL